MESLKEKNEFPISGIKNDENINYVEEQLHRAISYLKANINEPTASNAKIISILQEHVCLRRCDKDIRKEKNNGSGNQYEYQRIDPLYIARHDKAKNDILEEINTHFLSMFSEVKSEHDEGNGRLDISIEDNRIIINGRNRKIGIEIKSGRSADAKYLNQLIRYLINVDVLIFVRVPTQTVDIINKKDIIGPVISSMSTVIDKIYRIISKDISVTQGDCCRGCTVNCEFRMPSKFSESPKANLSDFAEYLNNLEVIKAKVIEVLDNLLSEK